MSLRARVVAYLIVIHLVFAFWVAWAAGWAPLWLLGVEFVALASLATGLTLATRLLRGLDVGDDGARFIREGELTARLRPIGDRRIDELITVYNRMVDTLRHERVRVEEQQRFLEQVIDASPSGMIVLDFDGRISRLNPAAERLLGVADGEATGAPLAALSSPLAAPLAGLQEGGVDIVGLTGGRRVRCHRGRFIDRGFPRAFFVIEELTDEARRFERAAYEKLIRVMSHEVNNSITASNSLLESSLTYAAELPPASRAELEQALRIVIDRTAQLNRFMRRFADVFRLPAPARQRTDLRGLVEGLITLMRARPDAPRFMTSWARGDGPVYVEVDAGQFEQVCLNVLKNAAEAAGPGGMVTAGVTVESARVVLTVDDTGPGPSAEAQEFLFTPFYSTKPQGQGIGLTLVQEVLSGHGAGYSLERLPGGPTRFTIQIPRA